MAGWNLKGRSAGAQAAGAAVDGTAAASEGALTVSQAARMAADALDGIPQLTVLGEVTGFKGPNARSGHCYFQIKDDAAAFDCIVWRGVYGRRTFDLRDGLQVVFTGKFNLYERTGRMSFVASSFALAGEGLLRQQVAALAEKLRREGLMEPARKRPIPAFCQRVAVVTSLSGAVIDDVKRTLRRRNPLVEIVCVGAKVQGEGAPAELIEGLRRAAAIRPAPDCILLVRGGGSFEDLMTFNDEALARAVASCPVPVVTGIGHEPDTSICDMVSDRRASTPTAAAESVAPAMSELVELLDAREQRLGASLTGTLRTAGLELDGLAERSGRAMEARLARQQVALAALASRPCLQNPASIVDRRRMDLAQSEERLAASVSGFDRKRHALELTSQQLKGAGRRLLSAPSADLARSAAALDALSPLKVLARGYAIAYDAKGVATQAAGFAPGDALRVRFADGSVSAQVTSTDIQSQ